ncbi:MAG: hypothetical protein HOV94_24985 [Saccharothrix sp.]|nr:hypothetical protein [Saccharothrix sp.]
MYAQLAIFVAGCAERMAQVFTGLSGGDATRRADIDAVIRLVDDLWVVAGPGDLFRSHLESLKALSEFKSRGEEIVDVADIYAFYSALALRYAVVYRLSSDVAVVLKCAHVCLTATGQLDRNIPGASFFAQELELQRGATSVDSGNAGLVAPVTHLRMRDKEVSRERLAAIRGRLAHYH